MAEVYSIVQQGKSNSVEPKKDGKKMVQIGDQNEQPTNPGGQEARNKKYRLMERLPKAKTENK